jgi:hypothetical protein
MSEATIKIDSDFISPYKLAKLANCLPQAIYQQVRNGVGMLGKSAVRNETDKWMIPSDVAMQWLERYNAKKNG